jgi:antitoxin (DNA-binding transcriptional repressor) of toxin-antitoxin stability system
MSRRVALKDAAHHLPELLDRVEQDRESFLILRGDKEVGQIVPVAPRPKITLREFVEFLGQIDKPDPEFAEDLERIRAEQPFVDGSPWRS